MLRPGVNDANVMHTEPQRVSHLCPNYYNEQNSGSLAKENMQNDTNLLWAIFFFFSFQNACHNT